MLSVFLIPYVRNIDTRSPQQNSGHWRCELDWNSLLKLCLNVWYIIDLLVVNCWSDFKITETKMIANTGISLLIQAYVPETGLVELSSVTRVHFRSKTPASSSTEPTDHLFLVWPLHALVESTELPSKPLPAPTEHTRRSIFVASLLSEVHWGPWTLHGSHSASGHLAFSGAASYWSATCRGRRWVCKLQAIGTKDSGCGGLGSAAMDFSLQRVSTVIVRTSLLQSRNCRLAAYCSIHSARA